MVIRREELVSAKEGAVSGKEDMTVSTADGAMTWITDRLERLMIARS